MNIKSIKTHAEYKAALSLVDTLCNAQVGTTDFDTLNSTVASVEAYEAKAYPIGPPDQAAVIEYEAEKRGLTQKNGDAA